MLVSVPVPAQRIGIAALVALAFAGCTTTFEGPKIDYRSEGKAQSAPSLEIPPDLSSVPRDERYAVPQSAAATAAAQAQAQRTGVTPGAGAGAVLPTSSVARVVRDGNLRYLIVNQSPDQVWPVLRSFWTDNGFTLRVEDRDAGVMETDWAENRAKLPQDIIRKTLGSIVDNLYDTGLRDMYRVRIERGDGGTEIYVTHRGMEEVLTQSKDSTRWQGRPSDPSLEAEFLQRLLVRFGVDEVKAKTEVATATPVRSAPRARMVGTTLALDDGYERGWRRVGIALDRVGFTVESRDRATGVYGVRFVQPGKETEEDPGFFAKLFGAKPDRAVRQYKILVKDVSGATQVSVLSAEGGADQSEASQRILELLQGELK